MLTAALLNAVFRSPAAAQEEPPTASGSNVTVTLPCSSASVRALGVLPSLFACLAMLPLSSRRWNVNDTALLLLRLALAAVNSCLIESFFSMPQAATAAKGRTTATTPPTSRVAVRDTFGIPQSRCGQTSLPEVLGTPQGTLLEIGRAHV